MDVTRLAAMQHYSIQPPGHKPLGHDADIDSQARVGTADGITDRITEAQSSCIQAFLAAHSSHPNSVWHCTFEAHSTSDSEAEAAPGPGMEPRERSAMHHTRWRRANSVSGDPEGWRLPGDQLRCLSAAAHGPRRSMSSSDGLAAADCWQQGVQGLSSPGEEAV
ncbi:hypothetical protein HaLaN_10190 [Haematococcus lacustris]|uniref:Uncharacterized protein n=1 Tax=Haematococcus lacustris TaxID=44745 RepID=A0A699Z5I9_HAELA|nr:hypothetical protein HaLaN_10190 [Haematococcus lacustris]